MWDILLRKDSWAANLNLTLLQTRTKAPCAVTHMEKTTIIWTVMLTDLPITKENNTRK